MRSAVAGVLRAGAVPTVWRMPRSGIAKLTDAQARGDFQRGLWASRYLVDADLLPPDPECPRASSAIGGRGHEVPSRPEVAVDHRVHRQESLCLTVRFELLHLSLSSSRGSMRILSPIVQIAAGPVSHIRHDRSLSNAVAAQAVRDEASWLIAKPTQQMLEEPLGGGAIPPLLHQNIQDDTMLIDGATVSAARHGCG
jgi:hypothetical protein